MLKKLFSVLVLLTAIQGYCQLVIPEPAKITIQDLAEKTNPQDSTATAAYLYHRGKTWFELDNNSWVMVTEIYNRIKIYKKGGYKYASPKIDYYSGNNKSKGYFNEGNTYNLVGGIMQKATLKKDAEFTQQLNEKYTGKTINLADVKEGSIIEYKYTIRTTYVHELRDFYFQYDIPLNDARYDVWIPVYFYYNIYTIGKGVIENSDVKNVLNEKTETHENYSSYTAKNVKAIKDEAYVNNLDNYTATLKHELSAVALPNQQPVYYATDWKAVAKSIYDEDGFGRELKYTSYFNNDIDPLLAIAKNDTDKANIVFDFVKSRMNWDGNNRFTCEVGVKKAYAAKVGNSAEINLMLTAMLRHADLDANPVLVSTRANGVAVFPTRTAYNYVIAAVKIADKTLLLDATSKYAQPNIMPLKVLNWNGRLIKKNGDTEEVNLMPKINSKEVINIMGSINADGTVSGRLRDQYHDYRAFVFREKYADMSEESYLEKLEDSNKGITVTDYKVLNQKDVSKPLTEDYSFVHNQVVERIGNKMYVSPLLFLSETVNPFKQETRQFPVDFTYPRQNKYLITLKIPEGYKLESLPKSLSLAMEENIGSFKYDITATDINIQLSVIFDINDSIISEVYYKTLKDFYQKVIEKQNEKIVLVKS